MAAKLNIKLPLPDKEKLKIMGAKFNAWWNGTEFVEIDPETGEEPKEQAGADADAEQAEMPANDGQELDASSAPLVLVKPDQKIIIDNDSAIFGASCLWGDGRLTPSSDGFDLGLVKELGLNKSNKFGLFSSDIGATAANIIKAANCKTEGYFAQSTIKEAAQKYIKASGLEKLYSSKAYDGTPKSVPKSKFDQVLMLYLSGTKPETESNIFALARMLKPKGSAAWVNFVTRDNDERLEESSGHERRQYLNNSDILPAFEACGLVAISNEEYSADLLNAYYKRQSYIVENWESIQGKLMQNGGIEAVQAALEQTMVWRARINALKSGRLHLRKIILKHG